MQKTCGLCERTRSNFSNEKVFSYSNMEELANHMVSRHSISTDMEGVVRNLIRRLSRIEDTNYKGSRAYWYEVKGYCDDLSAFIIDEIENPY